MDRSFWNALLHRLGNQARLAPDRRLRARHSFRPALVALEDRTVPTTLSVTGYEDGSPGAVGQVLVDAVNGDLLVFDHSLIGQTIDLSSSTVHASKNLSITGLGSQLTVTGGSHSVFNITANMTLSDLKLAKASTTSFTTDATELADPVAGVAPAGDDIFQAAPGEISASGGLAGRIADLLGRTPLDVVDTLITADTSPVSAVASLDIAPDFAGILDALECSGVPDIGL